ncbi:MAG: FHA domain-containing protein, partial [Chloroflexota bacterium]
ARPIPDRTTALIEIRSRNGQPWAFVFRGGVVRIGRGTENEIVLKDDRVSRHHGQLTARQGTLVYTDLGSSNGSQVNGVAAREIALTVGDVVRVGNSTLTIRPAV